MLPAGAHTFIGISGYDYPRWRGAYYPDRLPRTQWLGYASRCFNSIELNETFYSLKSPFADELAADFLYIRLHGSQQLYVSGYTDEELDDWAGRIRRWRAGSAREAYVSFDNDAKVHAPHDAQRLAERFG